MSGFAQFIFILLMFGGLLFIWSTAGFIYVIIKYAKNPPPGPPSDTNSKCVACANLCSLASTLTFQEQILIFPNLVVAFIACKIVGCDCE